MSREQADFELAQFALKQAKWISSTVALITHTIKANQILKANGANFSRWTRQLKEIGRTSLTGSEFFFEPSKNLSFERIRHAVFLASIHPSLVSNIQDTTSVKAMYDCIRKKFQTVSHAVQMNLWYKLLAFKIDPTVPTAGIATQLKDIYAAMKVVNVRMHGNVLLGFILQAAIMSSLAGFKKDFEQRVELHIQRDPQLACPSFDQLVYYFDICRQQYKLTAPQPATQALSSNTNSLMMFSPAAQDNFDCSAFLADIEELDWSVSALETTLLPKRLQQCLTQILCSPSFNFIYGMCHSCVVLFRRNEE
jgi:hypothetical protein